MSFRVSILSLGLALSFILEPLPDAQLDRVAAVRDAQASIETLIQKSGAEVAVVWQPVTPSATGGAESIRINAGTRFHAASMMKVPVMIALFEQAHLGRLRLDDSITVTNRFASIADGSPYALSVTDDSDDLVYKAIGSPMSYRALAEAMITVSSNLASNILIDTLTPATIRKTTAALGASGIEVLRGVEDQKAFDRGLNNTTDAAALATLFLAIATESAVSPASSREMRAMLARQRFNGAIPAGLPAGTPVAHKTGSITRIRHDGGIVLGPRPYVLVVLTRGLDDARRADALIAEISRVVWQSAGAAPGMDKR